MLWWLRKDIILSSREPELKSLVTDMKITQIIDIKNDQSKKIRKTKNKLFTVILLSERFLIRISINYSNVFCETPEQTILF